MKVTCTLTVDDCIVSSRSRGQRIITAAPGQIKALRGQRMVYWMMAALTIGGPLLALPGSIYLGLNVHFAFFAATVFSLVFSVTMVIAFYRSLTGKAARTTFAANEKSAGPYTAEVTPECFTYTAPEWRSEIEWCAILRVAETDALLLIIDDTPRSMIVTKRAFASPGELEEFTAAVTRAVAGSKRSDIGGGNGNAE